MDEELDVQAAAERVSDMHREGMAALADTVTALSRDLTAKTDECEAAHEALAKALHLVESQGHLIEMLSLGGRGVDLQGLPVDHEELADLRRQLAEARLREDARQGASLRIDREDMDAIMQAWTNEDGTSALPNPRADRLNMEMRSVQAALQTVLGGIGLWRDSAIRGGLKRVLKALDAVLTRDDREAGVG